MARPTKHPSERRTKRFNLRFTLAELEHVETQANLAGLEPTEYLRRRSLDYEVPLQSARADAAGFVTELNRLALALEKNAQELSAIGNNANQIARALNSGRRSRIDWDTVGEEIERLSKQSRALLEQASETLERTVLDDS